MRLNPREKSRKRYIQKGEIKYINAKWTVTRKNAVLQKTSSAPQIECEAETCCCFKKRKP